MSNAPLVSNETVSLLIDYPARDMTITVDATMKLGQLLHILKEEQQQLPIDSADMDITIGDLVAFDVSGPRQFGYGTLRDYVIGIEASDGTGRVFHAGGRVVKNVAGYDLCRLLIGAEGRLGTLRQLTFKLKPLPVEQHLAIASFRTLKDLSSALERLNLTLTTPQILDVVSRDAAEQLLPAIDSELTAKMTSTADALLLIGFDGSRKACDWQSKTIAEELHGTAGSVTTVGRPDAVTMYCRAAMQFSASHTVAQPGWLAKVRTLPSRVVSVLQFARDFELPACGRAGNGTVFLRADSGVDAGPVRDGLKALVDGGLGYVEIREQDQTWRHPVKTTHVERYSAMLQDVLQKTNINV